MHRGPMTGWAARWLILLPAIHLAACTQSGPRTTSVVDANGAPTAAQAVAPKLMPPARSCNTLEENKQATADMAAAIADARSLAQAAKMSEAREAIEKAREIEAACFGSLKPSTNWPKIEGELYAIDAIRRFPELPSEWRAKCARKADVLSKDEVILCGPGFVYYAEPQKEAPFALVITAMDEENPPSSADACYRLLETTAPGSVARATLSVNFMGPVKKKFYEKGDVLLNASWVRVGKKAFCYVTGCRKDSGKAPMGGKCAIPETAKAVPSSIEQ
jgi:hypothetical protein